MSPTKNNKTFAGEIEERLKASAAYTDGVWRWHMQRWGDLDVLVLPRRVHMNPEMRARQKRSWKVKDSNTGIVVAAPKHAYLLGNVVVNDGARITCDIRALNHIVTGDASFQWDAPGLHAYAVPSDSPESIDAQARPEYLQRVLAARERLKAQGIPDDQETAQAEFMAGWGAFTIQCSICRLVVPCGSVERVMSEAKRYEFKMIEKQAPEGIQKRAICRRCANDPGVGPVLPWPESL